jgi:hypothetical protein
MRFALCVLLHTVFSILNSEFPNPHSALSRANFFMDDTEVIKLVICIYLLFKRNMRTVP